VALASRCGRTAAARRAGGGTSTEQGHELFRQLAFLTADTTVLFIEHDMNLVFRYADRVSVFAAGALVVQDTPDRVRNHPRVREVYLGV
jgi:branched-chain amino acid transport system ATP-binding protein